jgi:hypothetical protein
MKSKSDLLGTVAMDGAATPVGKAIDKPRFIEREALPLNEYFAFVGVGSTKGYELIKAGALKTRRIARKRIGLISDGRAFLRSLPTE